MTIQTLTTPLPPGDLDVAGVIARRAVRTVFQPIIQLATGRTVAAEALSRGPAATPLEPPAVLLAEAEEAGLLAALDDLMLTTALATADRHDWSPSLGLFVNLEPRALGPESMAALHRVCAAGVALVVEFTERAIASDVAGVLRAAQAVRVAGGRIALDDVGADPASLALIALLRPDVVKLDMQLIRDYGIGHLPEIANAVRSYAEESGAAVVAEGIETTDDRDIALVLGADLGQGWLFGRPADTPPQPPSAGDGCLLPRVVDLAQPPDGASPWQLAERSRPMQVGEKRLLLPLSHALEQRTAGMVLPPLLFSAFQHARHFTGATARRYDRLAAALPLVCVLGLDTPAAPVAGVYGAALDPLDPLCGEWSVVVLGAHFAGALIARDLGDDGAEPRRRFAYCVTHDRSLVLAAARSLASRLVSQPAG